MIGLLTLVLSLSKDAPEPRPPWFDKLTTGQPAEMSRMDFDLNDEQRQLKDSVDRLLADTLRRPRPSAWAT